MENIMKIFGENAFTESNLKKRVPKKVFEEFKKVQKGEIELTKENAELIANAIKDWATKRNATHFCHWFQPLTELTAEKHDSFIEPNGDKDFIYRFSGSNLIKGESDASSFPNGGLRSTFEARGYTVWDTNSPPFIKENEIGATLYIPTSFISYNGEALDKKLPLLRSMNAINKSATRVLNLLGYTEIKNVIPTLGVEQEYFLIKKEHFDKRKDIMFTGRTLFGAKTPKNQESSFHYYGKIKDKVINFMANLDYELWKIGVSAKTRHNEVAPNQFEIASIFDVANLAADQNHIVMETLEKLALKHDFVALLHEKPFSYVNGSGKHNNWSLATDTGVNLFDPKSPTFMVFLSAVIEAIDRYYPVLRSMISSCSNDYRLGGHEAPPSIISVFLGSHLTEKFKNAKLHIVDNKIIYSKKDEEIKKKVTMININQDFDDRNRTSPFAFTGNKFEFRMPGSTSSPANTSMVINAVVSTVLNEYADKLEKSKDIEKTINYIISDTFKNHSRIIFNGDGYSKKWHEEAQKRGLKNISNTFEALKYYLNEEIIYMFESNNILNKIECQARYIAFLNIYVSNRLTECNTLIYMIDKYILNFAYKYIPKIIFEDEQIELKTYTNHLIYYKKELIQLIKQINEIELEEKAELLSKNALNLENKIREIIDYLEVNIPAEYWNLPTYTELLFTL
ncbi:glutamine synthetase III [Streptobacillus notomytis]|uniref:glutamine synthetase III n=1 Tax=Streptobacillus notomytis TaxID=1712031 RepID=UPI0009366C52|nr:glutamine synthetase III [Streptobacillus notomytis]